ncbi:MAG TPA: hypothetical protein VIT62_14490 [Lysobacter sp.]
MIDHAPFEPPDPEMVERIDKALQRHLAERNRADKQQQHRAAERVLERLLDREGE